MIDIAKPKGSLFHKLRVVISAQKVALQMCVGFDRKLAVALDMRTSD